MKIKNLIGNILIIGGIILGLWLTIWVMLAGGIMQIVDGVQTGVGSDIAWGIIRILFSECGMIPTYILWMAGELIKID